VIIITWKETGKKKQAEVKQILLCFATLCALMPIMKEENKGVTALTCHLFTVEKFLAINGSHDKFKSRLVAHRNEQDILMYPDHSLPMVSMQGIMA
jgi:hypothetical protein